MAPKEIGGGGVEKPSALQSIKEDAERYGFLSSFMLADDALQKQMERAHDLQLNRQVDLQKAHNSSLSNAGGNDEFNDLFESELQRVTATIESQLETQELSAKALLSSISAMAKDSEKNGPLSEDTLQSFRKKADELAQLCLKLQRFVARNAELLSEIATRADEELHNSSTMIFLKRKLAVAPWIEGPNSALVVVLSDIYEDIRKAEASTKNKYAKWVAPSSFERSTTKYWVASCSDKLTELLLAAVTEAPLLVYGRSGHLTTDKTKAEGDKLWDSLATPINSVYFDSKSMTMYKERIRRAEGAQLFRIRWYGDKPKGDEPVFLELKTHHEKWINVKSVKERVNIRERDVCRFLDENKNWNDEVAKSMVLAATPTLNGEKLEAQITLLHQMRKLVILEELRPCVRSMYIRAAFQSPDSNALRLTLDRNVTLVDETQSPPGTWCLPDDAVIGADMITRVPYPVFEIKLSNSEMPETFQNLIDSGTLIEAPKFSKFLTGAASFNSHKVDVLPYWSDEPVFKDMFVDRRTHYSDADDSIQSAKSETMSKMSKRLSKNMMAYTELFENLPDDVFDDSEDTDDKEEPTSSSDSTKKTHPVDNGAAKNVYKPAIVEESPRKSSGTSSKRSFASAAVGAKAGGLAAFGFFNKDHMQNKRVAPKRPARVEPKSYFANERTFIQWISAALLLVTVSVILLDFQSGNNVPSTAGIVLNFVAVFVVVYSMLAYYRRLRLLQTASPYGYVDHIGPLMLASAVLLGVVLLLIYYIEEHIESTKLPVVSVPPPTNTTFNVLTNDFGGGCFRRPTNGTSNLEYQPSAIYADRSIDKLLVPSLERVTSLSLSNPNSTVETLVTIRDADLEAITYVGERIFALSEGDILPILYEFSWQDSDGDSTSSSSSGASPQLQVIARWDLETPSGSGGLAEGLAYVDSSKGGDAALYVAGDQFDPLFPEDRGVIFVYDVPPAPVVLEGDSKVDQGIWPRRSTLNKNLINSNLKDSKIGDLVFFEDILFLLHDNERVIRAWDIFSGELLATTVLPTVGKGFNEQWEGLALQRPPSSTSTTTAFGSNNPALRGTTLAAPVSGSPLIVHMALDTPPQVWTFNATQGNATGSIVFPPCAAAT